MGVWAKQEQSQRCFQYVFSHSFKCVIHADECIRQSLQNTQLFSVLVGTEP